MRQEWRVETNVIQKQSSSSTGELGHVVMLYNLCTEMSKCSLYKRERERERERESSTSLFHLKENVGAMHD